MRKPLPHANYYSVILSKSVLQFLSMKKVTTISLLSRIFPFTFRIWTVTANSSLSPKSRALDVTLTLEEIHIYHYLYRNIFKS